ncbi:unnamed protein product [Lactuca virosa]|uniref:BHLH domain-containing protein n=1 Tax=Lactuca virosa TaxID=75947 RepID=A0AAU9LSS9_9ASTR|nr:unnamed protein product [Lactuca virosa]
MDRDFFLNAGLQFEPSSQSPWKLMTLMPEMNYPVEQASADGVSRPNYSHFESALSSMVSSPVSNSTVSNDIVAVRELIGKFRDGSPAAMTPPLPYSNTNTPLNPSPPKLNLPIIDHFMKENLPRIRNSMPLNPNLPLLTADPGFAERAAKFSCFGSRSFNGRTHQLGINPNSPEFQIGSNGSSPLTSNAKFPRVSSSPALKIDPSPVRLEDNRNSEEINMKLSRLPGSAANSNEESSVSEQIPSGELGFKNQKDSNTRKRKGGSSKGIGSTAKKEEEPIDDSNSKKMKKPEQENGDTKPQEAPKDYIHVRARRGQATDSHSLAERVRREKIGERMKLLQNLVPNCDKVTGKALMLDEIINYVQSLQRQVEFLSMKLATVNPCLDFDGENPLSQNANQSNVNLSQPTHHVQSSTSTFYQQNQQVLFNGSAPVIQSGHQLAEPFLQFPGFGQDDLQSIVQMGFGENLDLDAPFFRDQPSNMKMEL